MSFQKLIKDRFSVREFKNTPLPQDKLDIILDAGRLAPTAKNSQLQRFKILTTPDDLAKVDQCTTCRYGAPVVILICGKTMPDKNWDISSAFIATTHLMLQAQDLGVGSCWIQNFDADATKKLFNLPADITPYAFLPLGYPAINTSRYHGVREPIEHFMLED